MNKKRISYSIGVILANIKTALSEEVILDSIEITMEELEIDYKSTDLIEGYANSFDIGFVTAIDQIRKIKENTDTITNINNESLMIAQRIQKDIEKSLP